MANVIAKLPKVCLPFFLLMLVASIGLGCKPKATPALAPNPTPGALPQTERSDDDLFGDDLSGDDDEFDDQNGEEDDDHEEDKDDDEKNDDEDEEEENLKDILNCDDELAEKLAKERRTEAMIQTVASLPGLVMGLGRGDMSGAFQTLAFGAETMSPGGGALVGAGVSLLARRKIKVV